jgi:hypothetical protein
MAKYGGKALKSKATSNFSSKRQRRTEIDKIIKQLEIVRNSEERYQERIPENLQSSEVYEKAEEWVNVLTEVIEMLEELP